MTYSLDDYNLIVGAGGGGKGGGGGGASAPVEDGDNLNSTSFARIVDLIAEGEIEGFATPSASGIVRDTASYNAAALKDIYVEDVALLRETAVIKSGVYSQASSGITITCSGHGYTVGQKLQLQIQTGTAATGSYTVATAAGNSFTAVAKNGNTSSGVLAISKLTDYNFRGFSFDFRYGTSDQTFIPGFARSESTISVGLEVENGVPIVRSITNENVEEVVITIRVPALQEIKSNGDLVGSSFTFAIDVAENGGEFASVGGERTITGRTPDPYDRSYSISLKDRSFPVDVRVRRTSGNSTSAKVANAFQWLTYTERVNENFSYINSALVACKINASQFNRVPSRAYRIRGRKVRIPNNATVDAATGALIYNDQPWTGEFQSAKWTSDPAWCLWDLLTNVRFGTGEQILTPAEQANYTGEASRLDKWAFYAASKYCTAQNTRPAGSTNDYHPVTGKHGVPTGKFNSSGQELYEPRFSCNVNLQNQEEVFSTINNMCSVFRCMPYGNAGALTIAQDRPVDPTFIFNTSNVTDAGFTYSSASKKTRPNIAIVSYYDMTTRTLNYEQVEDKDGIIRDGALTVEVDGFACKSQSQAHRLGEWLLYSNAYEAETVSFVTSLDAGIVVRPGQVIGINDPTKAGYRRGGRIASGNTTTILADDTTEIVEGASPTLTVVLPTGLIETRPVSTISGNTITVSSGFSQAPAVNSMWAYSTSSLSTSYWRVLGIQENDGVEYTVNAIAYNSSKYDYIERGVPLQVPDTTDLNEAPPAPTDPTTEGAVFLSEALYEYQNSIFSKIVILWSPALNVYEYLVRWRKDDNNWNETIVTAPNADILDTSPGVYEVEVYSLNALRRRSIEALSDTLNALGKTAPPSDVGGLSYAIDPYIGAILTWGAVSDIDLAFYEIRTGASFDTGALVTQVKATTYKIGYLDDGSYRYWVKAVDTSGVYSTNAANALVSVSLPGPAGSLTATVQDPLVILSWTEPTITSYAIKGYRIKQGSTYAGATELGVVQTTSFSVPASWLGSQTFWVAPIDNIDNENPASSVVATINTPATPINGSAVFAGSSVVLNWDAVGAANSVAVQLYEIKYGSGSYDSAALVATTKGTSFTVDVDWTGSRTFQIKAIDNNGNRSTNALSIVATTIAAPSPNLTFSFAGRNVVLSWNVVAGNLPVIYYKLKQGNVGDTWSTATDLADINGTSYTLRANWLGNKRFFVAAISSNGEEGGVNDEDVVVTAPSEPFILQQVVDNNVLLRWNDVTNSLPIEYYKIKRSVASGVYSGATEIGTKQGLFTTVFETQAGDYRYWVAGVDSAGNEGTAGSVIASVNQPPDYILLLNQDSTFSGTKNNVYYASGIGLIANVATGETWQSHFSGNSWSSIQDQLNAGYTHYLMPTPASGTYEEQFDYGSVIGSSKVSALLTTTNVVGTTTVSSDISVRAASGDPWTVYSGVDEVYATNFRYVKLNYRFTASGGDDLLVVNNLNLRLDSKLKTDAGSGSAASGDASGTTVSFNTSFIDVQSITVTAGTTSPLIAVYNFVDEPYPSGFKVLLFTPSGVRTDGTFSWTARGV